MPSTILICTALCANFIVVHGHDRQRIFEIVILLLAGILMLTRRIATPADPFAGASGKALCGFFALGLLSSITAFSSQYAFFEVAIFFLLYLLATSLAGEIARRGTAALQSVVQVVAAIVAFQALGFVLTYIGSVSLHLPISATDFTTGFSNIRFFNHAQTPTLPLLILLCCLTPRAGKFRWLCLAVTAYWWMALFATAGRGTLMGMAAGGIAVAILLRRTAVPYLRQAAATAGLGLAAYFVLLVAVPVLAGGEGMNAFSAAAERTAADPASGRMLLWHRAWASIAEHPLLGLGPMQYAHRVEDNVSIAAHPHDWLLQIGSEWGLPALACLLAALALGLRSLLRAGAAIAPDDQASQSILTAMVAGAVAILADALVSGLFVMPQSQLAIILYLGCAMGWYRTTVPAAPSIRPVGAMRLASVALVVAALVGIGSVWSDIPARWAGARLTPAQETANRVIHWPRLWEAGHF